MFNNKPTTLKERKLLKFAIDTFDRIHFYRPSLPLFYIDWKITMRLQNVTIVRDGKLVESISSYRQKWNKMIISQGQGRYQRDKKEDTLSKKTKVHLILEGISTSNEYFCTYYSVLEDVFTHLL